MYGSCTLHGKKPENMFSGGKGGQCLPILARLFSTNQKRGLGFELPQIFGPTMNLITNAPENTVKRRKMP